MAAAPPPPRAEALTAMARLLDLVDDVEKKRGVRVAGVEGMRGEIDELHQELETNSKKPDVILPSEDDSYDPSGSSIEDNYRDITLVMQLIRDNLYTWDPQLEQGANEQNQKEKLG